MNNLFNILLSKTLVFNVFYSLYTVPEIRNVTVLIDTGLNITEKNVDYLCQKDHFDLTGTGLADRYGHGTMMFNLIVKNIDHSKNCITIIKWCDKCLAYVDHNLKEKLVKASEIARDLKPKFVNMSYVGSLYSNEEKNNIQIAIDSGTMFSVAAGNEGKELNIGCDNYPACYFVNPQFHVLGALFAPEMRAPYSNYGNQVTHWEIIQDVHGGTSSATANHTNKLIRELVK